MKLRKEVSLFMAKSKHVDFIVIVRSLLLVTIFVVGILSCAGGVIDSNRYPSEKLTSADIAARQARESTSHMGNAELQEAIKYRDNKISELHYERRDIYEQSASRVSRAYGKKKKSWGDCGMTGLETTKVSKINEKMAVLRAERGVYQDKLDSNNRTKGCFTPDTKILMADGTLKDISNVVVGDILKSYNEETGRLVTTEVVKTYEFNQNHYYLVNKSIKITAKHTFLTDSGWKRVCDLKVGDKIKSQGKFIDIGSIDLIAPLNIKVYNLGVDNHHSFLVSDGVDSYVVHNCGGDGDGDGEDDFSKQ